MDSYLILPSSLKDLCNSFNLAKEESKGIFPFLLNNINYPTLSFGDRVKAPAPLLWRRRGGVVPPIKYFKNITLEEYEEYKEQFIDKIWNFKTEAITYCSNDCKALYQILSNFNKLVFCKFKLNITNYPTLPSLAFNLFRNKYLPEESIHMLSGEIDRDIRLGYTGGAVDVYIPKSLNERKIYAYDVNALYPYVMKIFKYPIGSPTYFTGNILKINPNAYGFFYCKIKSPSYLHHPILQTHVNTKEGIRNLAPLGDWEGMYFSLCAGALTLSPKERVGVRNFIMHIFMDINSKYYGDILLRKDLFSKIM
jgi:hypothetical protein